MELADSKLRCVLVFRIEGENPVLLANYDHANQYETHGGTEEAGLYGGKDKDYARVVSMVISNDPPSGATEAGGIGGFKVVQSDSHQVVYGADGNNICYGVICGLNYPARVAVQGLQELANDFTAGVGMEQIQSAKEKSLNNKSGKKILMSFCTKYDRPENVDKAADVLNKVEQVTSTMQDNVAQMLNNMEKAEDLALKSEQLNEQAAVFQKNSTKLKQQMKWKNMKMTIILGGIVFLILLFILVPLIARAKQLAD